jgi:predicted transcriptional regulator
MALSDDPPPSLRAWRQQQGLQGIEVAAILGYSPSYISRCESGTRRLSANAWRVLEAWAEQRRAL